MGGGFDRAWRSEERRRRRRRWKSRRESGETLNIKTHSITYLSTKPHQYSLNVIKIMLMLFIQKLQRLLSMLATDDAALDRGKHGQKSLSF